MTVGRAGGNCGEERNRQRVVIQRVPNYNNLTVNGTLTGSDYGEYRTMTGNAVAEYRHGVLAFRVAGTLSGSGVINADALGFYGGWGCNFSGMTPANGRSFTWVAPHGGGIAGPAGDWPALGGGGGGHSVLGSQGINNGSAGGQNYGSPELARLYLGSGGGGAGCETHYVPNTHIHFGGGGGYGGGIVFIAASTINFSGQVNARGAGGGSRAGSGSGGSIRIEGGSITMNTASVSGGATEARGAEGRIAVYYETSFTANFTPGQLRSSTEMLVTPTATPIAFIPLQYGDGGSGDLNVPAGTTFNIHTQTQDLFFQCRDGGDAVSYRVSSLSATSATLSSTPSSGCVNIGDEYILVNLRGGASYANVGRYEFLRVGSTSGNIVYFTTTKIQFYGDNAGDDNNAGTNQLVILQRVPNYNNAVVNGRLTGSDFDGLRYGLIVFRVRGVLSGGGWINADYLGYRGGLGSYKTGNNTANGLPGESYGGAVGVHGGGAGGTYCALPFAGGGGHAVIGGINNSYPAPAGRAYGAPALEQIFFGSGGGGGGTYYTTAWINGMTGGDGGGAVYILADTIQFSGQISARGEGADEGSLVGSVVHPQGGGGSGGSVRIEGDVVNLDTVNVLGGTLYARGSRGRVAVYYSESFSSDFSPGYLWNTSLNRLDSIASDDFEDGLALWATPNPPNTNLAASAASAYSGYAGLGVTLVDNNALYASLSHPGGERAYRARVYVNADSLTMATGDLFTIMSGQAGATAAFELQLQRTSTARQVRLVVTTDSGATTATGWFDLPAGWHALEVSHNIAILAGASDGSAALWLDGALKQTLTGIDNDTRVVTSLRLGAQGVDSGTRGKISFDDFDARRFSVIGMVPNPGIPVPTPTPQAGYENLAYSYSDPQHVHAVTGLSNGNQYRYDDNGNMTCRVSGGQTQLLSYNSENRTAAVSLVSGTCDSPGDLLAVWTFVYDGDGVLVKQVYTQAGTSLTTRLFFGRMYQMEDDGVTTTTSKYLSFGGQTVLVDGSGSLQYLLSDHLGSTVAVANGLGALVSETRYLPFGGVRTDVGAIAETDLGYTGQRNIASLGLMDYRARFYDPSLKRFTQPDSIVPGAGNSQAWNRYAYVGNNPVRYNDPSGHNPRCGPDGIYCDRSIPREEIYGITFDGETWTELHKQAVLEAVERVAQRFAIEIGVPSGFAWSMMFGYLNFTWGSLHALGDCAKPSINSGGCTTSSHQINFWSMSGDADNTYFRMVKNVVHEIGHAYNNSLYNPVTRTRPSEHMPASLYRNRDSFLRPNMWTNPDTGVQIPLQTYYDWQQNPTMIGGETFADMFIAWTYNAWNIDPYNAGDVSEAQVWMSEWLP